RQTPARVGCRPMELGPNVNVLEDGERTIYLIGTAHISERSVVEVRQTIEQVRPDTVCVELCKTRFEAISDNARWRTLDIFQVIRQRKVLYLLSSLALSAYQRRMGEKLGVRPGAELREAVTVAGEVGAELVLADRDIQATLKRTWANVGFFGKLKVLGALFEGFLGRGDEELTAEDLEKLKERDHLNELMSEFARVMPQVKTPLIDERDQYLMSSIEDAPGKTIVAVVGAGHVPGMMNRRGEKVDREALSVIPPPSKWVGALKWVIPAIILAAFYFGWRKHAGDGLAELVLAWVLPNAILAALFSLIAGAKPLSVLVAGIASPITSLNPTIGAGMVVGLLEAWLRKPTVADAERLSEDMLTWRGIYKNPFSRVLLVAIAATLGSAMGAWVATPLVLARL
ncbi:MAG: TraB/GumN family protein, partial [Myxococcales bacterium]|nr:TraB/GumN family protein [Myxococcales bacterium]